MGTLSIKFPSKVAVHPVGAWITVTSTGLPVAPVAVTCMVAVRAVLLAFAVKLHVIVPESVPLAPDDIKSQLSPEVTVAVQGMVPTPVFETLMMFAGFMAYVVFFFIALLMKMSATKVHISELV